MFADRADAGRRLAHRLLVGGTGRPGPGASGPGGRMGQERSGRLGWHDRRAPRLSPSGQAGEPTRSGQAGEPTRSGQAGEPTRPGQSTRSGQAGESTKPSQDPQAGREQVTTGTPRPGPVDEVPVVLALPRGGVPVGAEVAAGIGGLLDVVPARKIGTPGQPELALGAIAAGGLPVWNSDVVARFGLGPADLAEPLALARAELARRVALYSGGMPPAPVAGRTAIVVDDGLATGATARAALLAVRARRPAWLVLAVPVAAPETVAEIYHEGLADAVVVLATPVDFRAVGSWYEDFTQVDDETVLELLARARRQPAAPAPSAAPAAAPGAAPGA